MSHDVPQDDRLSIGDWLFVGPLVPLTLLQPRVLLRTLFGALGEPIGYILFAGYLIVVLSKCSRSHGQARRAALAITLFAIATAIRYELAGITRTITLQVMVPYIAGVAAAAVGFKPAFRRACVTAIAAAISIDALAILFPTTLVVHGLDEETAYGISRYGSAAMLDGRATGFHQSPGELVFFASVALGLGLGLVSSRHKILAAIMVAGSALCAMATANRSFILSFGAIAIYLAFVAVVRRSAAGRALPLVVVVIVAALAFMYGPYREILMTRLADREVEADSQTRLHGNTGVVDAIPTDLAPALIGTLALGPEREQAAFNGQDYLQPHNGLVWILATRGALFLAAIVYGLWSAVKVLWEAPTEREEEQSVPRTALLAGIVGGLAVSMVEPLLDTSSFLLLIGLALASPRRDAAGREWASKSWERGRDHRARRAWARF